MARSTIRANAARTVSPAKAQKGKHAADDAPPSAPGGGAFYARTLLDRHGVPPTERSRLVERVLGLNYSAAHRRMRGQVAWSIEDLEALARHFGETLYEVFFAAARMQADSATLVAGDLRLKCQLWPGPQQTGRPPQGGLVATRDGAQWTVLVARDDLPGPFYEVRQLLMEPKGAYGARIAVLDEDAGVNELLCGHLRRIGFRADAFETIGALRQALAKLPYDGYVLDWLVHGQTVATLVDDLRAADPRSAVAIFAGRDERGEAVAEIADVVARHEVRYFSKPLDPDLIAAVLSRLIAASTRA